MCSDIAIKVDSLGKCYHIYDQPQDRLKQSLYPRMQRLIGIQPKSYFREFWALKDISFEVRKGETVGIIGRNGAGKSTLLQLICGTLAPTCGSVTNKGRIAAMLELGSGFNPEFTGRENVSMNGAILGLTKDEIDYRFEDITAFADIGVFIEQPVKTYSSGMLVRLAFAVSVCIEPDVLIVDEALAVGDMNFQAKCMTALARMQKKGTTILFVSHDIGSIKSLCSRGIYLERGRLKVMGAAPNVAELYIRTMREEMNKEHRKFSHNSTPFLNTGPDIPLESTSKPFIGFKMTEEFANRVSLFRYGTGEVKTTFVELLNIDDEPVTTVEFNQQVKIRVFVKASAAKLISINFNVLDDKKNNITSCGFRHVDQPYLQTQPEGKYLAEYTIRLPLQEGNYSLRVHISVPIIPSQTAEFLDVVDDAVVFRVVRWEKAKVWSQVFLFPELTLLQLTDCDASS